MFGWRFKDDPARITESVLQKRVRQYLHDNFRVTTDAFCRDELLTLVLSVMAEDRVPCAVDHPLVSLKLGAFSQCQTAETIPNFLHDQD